MSFTIAIRKSDKDNAILQPDADWLGNVVMTSDSLYQTDPKMVKEQCWLASKRVLDLMKSNKPLQKWAKTKQQKEDLNIDLVLVIMLLTLMENKNPAELPLDKLFFIWNDPPMKEFGIRQFSSSEEFIAAEPTYTDANINGPRTGI